MYTRTTLLMITVQIHTSHGIQIFKLIQAPIEDRHYHNTALSGCLKGTIPKFTRIRKAKYFNPVGSDMSMSQRQFYATNFVDQEFAHEIKQGTHNKFHFSGTL